MEALKASRQMSNWNDDRIDELAQGVKDGFVKVDERFKQVDERFKQVDERFKEVYERFDKVDERFQRVEHQLAQRPTREEMRQGFAELKAQGAEIESQIEGQVAEIRTLIWGLGLTLLAGAFAVIAALIAFHG
ncbi:MAG: hypothetical protein ACTHK6_00320 [Solirubrobacterales bacterium]